MLLYRRLASPLHAARAGAGAAWTAGVIAAALVSAHPLVLGALVLAVALAGASAGVRRELRSALRALPAFGMAIVAVNVLVTRQGLTVFARLGDLGPFGQGDLTVEALLYGVVVWLKLGAVTLACALAALAVDSDQVLRSLRRLSFRSALTASLALRMWGVLAADAQRLAEAQRTRPAAARRGPRARVAQRGPRARAAQRGPRARVALLGAVVGSSLDRAMDVAATLELRGLAAPRRPARRARVALSRHDFAFAASAVLVPALALAGRLAGVASFTPYPTAHASALPATLALSAALAVSALLPFADRRGIEP